MKRKKFWFYGPTIYATLSFMPNDVWKQLGDVSRVSTSSAIAAKIMTLVRDANIPVGSVLPPERDLAEQLNVSRTTVREAIHELTLRGLLRRKQGSGTVLETLSSSSVALIGEFSRLDRESTEVTDFRQAFEPHIAALAAERRTETDLIMLENCCAIDPVAVTVEQSVALDECFHEALAMATHNNLIITLSKVTSEWLREFRDASHETVQSRATSLEGHKQVLQAVREQNSSDAEQAMKAHLTMVGRF